MKQLKRILQTTLFVVVLTAIAVFSQKISIEIIEGYNQCIAFLDNHTVDVVKQLGV